MVADPKRIAIIGGGFSGAALAANLLRNGRPVEVTLVNRYGPMGRGVAYRTRMEEHVLNVPAGQMSALEDVPGDFLEFARSRDASIRAGSFVSRGLYGEYLEELLRRAEAGAGPGAKLVRVVGEARRIGLDDGRPAVLFTGGDRVPAHAVVLALGNYSPADPAIATPEFYEGDRYVRDPWIRGSLDRAGEGTRVLLIGTGLTMLDIALDLRSRGVALPLHALSRHGLLPQAHRLEGRPLMPLPPPEALLACRPTARCYVGALRDAARKRERDGGEWREVVASIRASTPRLWRALDATERSRFLRHARPYWDVHRHRAAPATAARIARMLEAGDLALHAGRILALEERAGGVELRWRRRGADAEERLAVDLVVNCTGPSSDARRLADPLIVSLRASGAIRPDALGLGIDAADDGAVLDSAGTPSPVLFLVGPLLKARDWEATAVPELRRHAAALARRLLEAD